MGKVQSKEHKMAKWMTNGILKSINTKDKLYKKLVKMDVDGNAQYTTLKKEFNIFKKTLRSCINEAKRLYYLRTFALYKNDVKQTWAVIKDTLQKKIHSAPSTKFNLNNATVTNMDKIVKEFNTYFINIGRTLSDQIQSTHSSFDYLPQDKKTTSSLVFNPIRSWLFQTVNDPGGGALKAPPFDLENYWFNLHHIIQVNFTRCFWHDPIGIFQKFAILTILQRFQNKK